MAGECGFGSVYFSKLGRNTKVKEHCGPSNVIWRCQLPLIVPPTSPGRNETRRSCLRVGLAVSNEKFVCWEVGKPILFDDSFLHSAVHHGGEDDVADADDEYVTSESHDIVDHSNNRSSSSNHGAPICADCRLLASFVIRNGSNCLLRIIPPRIIEYNNTTH